MPTSGTIAEDAGQARPRTEGKERCHGSPASAVPVYGQLGPKPDGRDSPAQVAGDRFEVHLAGTADRRSPHDAPAVLFTLYSPELHAAQQEYASALDGVDAAVPGAPRDRDLARAAGSACSSGMSPPPR